MLRGYLILNEQKASELFLTGTSIITAVFTFDFFSAYAVYMLRACEYQVDDEFHYVLFVFCFVNRQAIP
jgi:hypothetical protein